jgi:hypothetical protein
MTPTLRNALIAAALCAGLAAPAIAANTAVVSVTLDTSSIVRGTGQGEDTGTAIGGFSPATFSVVLEAGDTLDLTIAFADQQMLTIDSLDRIWAYAVADRNSPVRGTGTFQFLAADGSVLLESVQKTNVESSVHFGQLFVADEFPGLPQSITFSGVRYVGTVDEYLEPGVVSRTYDSPGFAFDAADFSAAVPEPAGWALMLAGAGLLAAVRRRRA